MKQIKAKNLFALFWIFHVAVTALIGLVALYSWLFADQTAWLFGMEDERFGFLMMWTVLLMFPAIPWLTDEVDKHI